MVSDGKLGRVNVLEGSVRSGKTYVSIVGFGLWLCSMPQGGAYLLAGKTLTTLKRNVLDVMSAVFGDEFAYSPSDKSAKLFGRRLYLEGACDLRAESKLRGLTLQGAYCDELTLMPEGFFSMLLSRLSMKGSMLMATTNPDAPNHWLYKQYLSRAEELGIHRIRFNIDDNIFLDPDYVKQLKREYSGVMYQRYILGEWVYSDGVIFRAFADEPERYLADALPDDARAITIGIDFGGHKSNTAFVAVGLCGRDRFAVMADALLQDNRILDGEAIGEYLLAFIDGVRERFPHVPILRIRADSAEQYLINGLRKALAHKRIAIPVANAKKRPIMSRIAFVSSLLGRDKLCILKGCDHVVGSLMSQVWDNAGNTRLDNGTVDIDTADALEYALEEWM